MQPPGSAGVPQAGGGTARPQPQGAPPPMGGTPIPPSSTAVASGASSGLPGGVPQAPAGIPMPGLQHLQNGGAVVPQLAQRLAEQQQGIQGQLAVGAQQIGGQQGLEAMRDAAQQKLDQINNAFTETQNELNREQALGIHNDEMILQGKNLELQRMMMQKQINQFDETMGRTGAGQIQTQLQPLAEKAQAYRTADAVFQQAMAGNKQAMGQLPAQMMNLDKSGRLSQQALSAIPTNLGAFDNINQAVQQVITGKKPIDIIKGMYSVLQSGQNENEQEYRSRWNAGLQAQPNAAPFLASSNPDWVFGHSASGANGNQAPAKSELQRWQAILANPNIAPADAAKARAKIAQLQGGKS